MRKLKHVSALAKALTKACQRFLTHLKRMTELKRMQGRMGAIRSLRFSDDGKYMAMVEPADFIHVFDVNR